MGISDRLKYFIGGIGSVLDLSGNYFVDNSEVTQRYFARNKTLQQIDAEAIASDWCVVGEDLSGCF